MDLQKVELEILTNLTNYMVASGIIKEFVMFREKFQKIDPIYVDNTNVYYVTEFREGRKVKEFLEEQKLKYLNEDVNVLINNLSNNWQGVVNHILNYVIESLDKEAENKK